MRRGGPFANLIALVIAIALTTAFAGWWTVPIVAALWTYVFPRRGAVLYASVAGALAWGALLVRTTRGAGTGPVADLMGQIMNVPATGFVLLTLAYAALLAGSAALVAKAMTRE